jgi:hypothetical protein
MLQPVLTALMKLKREASELEAAAPVKEKYIFQPKSNAFSTDPNQNDRIHDA